MHVEHDSRRNGGHIITTTHSGGNSFWHKVLHWAETCVSGGFHVADFAIKFWEYEALGRAMRGTTQLEQFQSKTHCLPN
jgi:hypothetical protein